MSFPSFKTYLQQKKIDSDAFKQAQPKKWEALSEIFEQMHPDSFTAQKKFLFNDLRILYPLVEQS